MTDARLPRLRPDVTQIPGPPTAEGEPTTIVHDPLRNRFFRLGWLEREMLRRWPIGTARGVAAALAAETPLDPTADEVITFARFLRHQGLTEITTTQEVRALAAAPHGASGAGGAAALIQRAQRLVLTRIPLIHGDAWVRRHARKADALFSPLVQGGVAIAALVGLWRLAPQWDTFLSSFNHLYSLEGAVLLLLAVTLSKILHELGHAVAAARAGCRVTSMGVAFIVFWPVLYTDVSDAWRLRRRAARLRIAAAGVAAEGLVFVAALLAWPLLADGPVRTLCALFVSTIWVMTLIINLNPLMRFDGYFLLCDLLNAPNLQPRALTLIRQDLGRLLWGLPPAPDEDEDHNHRGVFRLYGVLLIAYRVALFVTIALLAYHLLFKAAGIVVFVTELLVFLGWPVALVLRRWWQDRHRARPGVVVRTLAVLAGGMALVVWPWPQPVQTDGVMQPAREARLFAEVPGIVDWLAPTLVKGASVAVGDALVRLRAPDLAFALEEVDERLAAAIWRLDHTSALGIDRDRLLVEREATTALLAEQETLRRRLAALVVRAPFAGTVVEVDPGLRVWQVRAITDPVAVVADLSACKVVAYVPERLVDRLTVGGSGRFFPTDGQRLAVVLTITTIAAVPASVLDPPSLASIHGGPVASRPGEGAGGAMAPVPVQAVYRVEARADACLGAPQVQRGRVLLDGTRSSLGLSLLRPLWVGLRQELTW